MVASKLKAEVNLRKIQRLKTAGLIYNTKRLFFVFTKRMHLHGPFPNPHVSRFCLIRAKLEVLNLLGPYGPRIRIIFHNPSLTGAEGSSADLTWSVH